MALQRRSQAAFALPYKMGLTVTEPPLRQEQPRFCPLLLFLQCHPGVVGETNVVSIESCAPRHNESPSAITSKRRPSSPLNSPRSKSRTNWFVDTRAPASLQTCAAATSRANPLLPKTPAPEHTARWWPSVSSWRPHRHVREETGIGSRRRLHNKRWNG